MTTMWTWIGGGNNEWNNPADWQPNGVPMPGDTLIMNGGTINVEHAIETLQLGGNDLSTVNLNGGDILTLTNGPSNVGPFMQLNVNAPGAIVNSNLYLGYIQGSGGINIAAGKSLILTGTLDAEGSFDITGRGTLIDDGNISAAPIRIDSNVLGGGTMTFTYTHDGYSPPSEVSGASSAGLTYNLQGGVVTVEHPNTFMSKVGISDGSTVTLAGLAATSYDLRGDFLTLYQGNKPVYDLRVADRSPDNMPIYVTSGASGVTIGVPYQASGPYGPPSDALPRHTMGV